MARREKGSGSWDTVTKNDITYYRYRKKYDGMTSRKEFVGRTKADVRRKIQEFEAKSMRVNQKDYRKMTLGECIDNILQTLEPTLRRTTMLLFSLQIAAILKLIRSLMFRWRL